jgi:NADH-quinone oxidoreductase subunit N
MDDYRGLFWRRPWLALVFTAMLLSLAGMPLTAGFVGKFIIASAGISMAVAGIVGTVLWVLVVSLVVTSVIGLFYYLRLAATMYARPEGEAPRPVFEPSIEAAVVFVTLVLLLFFFGLYPTPLLDLIVAAIASLA